MVTAPIFGETYDDPNTPFVIDKGLGLVDFALLPHLDHEDHPESSTAKVERMAAEVPVPTYAIDDETALKVIDGIVEVVSEEHWKLFTPNGVGTGAFSLALPARAHLSWRTVPGSVRAKRARGV